MFNYEYTSQYDCTICLSAVNSRDFVICQKVFTLKDHPGFLLANFNFPVSSGFCLGTLPWISFFSTFFLMDSRMLTKAKDKKRLQTPGCWNRVLFDLLSVFFILCSWSEFGRTMTSWKIHYCLRVSPHVRNVVGWDSVASWSFWNDFGRISRLTGVNIITLEMLKDCIRSWHDMVLKPVCCCLFSRNKGQTFSDVLTVISPNQTG